MTFTQERIEDGGVMRRSFELTVDGERVPAVIWAPEGAKGPRPLVLMGHGGSQHKKTPALVARARRYAQAFGYATLAIDAPGHGDRISREEADALAREVGARVRGETLGADRTPNACARWASAARRPCRNGRRRSMRPRASTSSARAARSAIGASPWARPSACRSWPASRASPPPSSAWRACAKARATFEAAAKKITIPLQFVFQWEDAVAPREAGHRPLQRLRLDGEDHAHQPRRPHGHPRTSRPATGKRSAAATSACGRRPDAGGAGRGGGRWRSDFRSLRPLRLASSRALRRSISQTTRIEIS